jgi:hypothetical protein
MNEIWQAAQAERGDKAFELFCDSKGLVFDNNDDIERELVGWSDVRLKPIDQLIELDKELGL